MSIVDQYAILSRRSYRTFRRVSNALFLVVSRLVFGIATVNIKGSKFLTSEGNQLHIKGAAFNCPW
jgi:hypothetical protein